MKLQLFLALLCGAPLLTAHAQDAPAALPAAHPAYDAALDRALELGKLNAWDEARAELGKALQAATSPEEIAYVYGQMGATYQTQKLYAEAATQFRKMMESAPEAQKQTAHLALATSLRDAKDFKSAGREAERILADRNYALSPIERMVALSIVGDAQLEAKNWTNARRSYDQVLSVKTGESDAMFDFTRATAHFNIGKSYLRGGQPLEARLQLRAVQESLAHLPAGEAMTEFLGGATQQFIAQSYLDEKDDANARAELEILLEMPNLPAAIMQQAQGDLAKINARLKTEN